LNKLSKTNKYLVIHATNTGFAELGNVGLFNAATEKEAIAAAKTKWNLSTGYTSTKLHAIDLEDCPDGWSYYT